MTLLSTIIAFLNLGASEIILLFFVFFIPGASFLIAFIFYILTLQSTLNSVSIENRKMPPNHVWLLLIPLFGLVWHFFVIRDMASSIHDEAIDRNIQLNESKPAYYTGLAMCIVSCLFFVPGVFIAALVLWILYWVKISGYKNQLSLNTTF